MIRPLRVLACVLLLAACIPTAPRAPDVPPDPGCSVGRVIDGDTVDLTCPGRGTDRARLMGFDTPEISRPGCAAERRLGLAAKARLRQLVTAAGRIDAGYHGTDRYGRALVVLRLDGRDVAQTLIAEGLAVPYAGGRRIGWCARLR